MRAVLELRLQRIHVAVDLDRIGNGRDHPLNLPMSSDLVTWATLLHGLQLLLHQRLQGQLLSRTVQAQGPEHGQQQRQKAHGGGQAGPEREVLEHACHPSKR
jgi:hypothetical protein